MFIFSKSILTGFRRTYWKWLIPLISAVYCYIEAEGRGDFYIFLSAAADLNLQQNIFEKTYVDGYHYYYSVFFAIILKPLASLPFFWVRFSWQFLNALLFFHLLRMLYHSEPVKRLSLKHQDIFIFLVFVSSLRFFMDNIHTSQITILILWCCIMGLYLISKNKNFSGAFILALGINIKLLPLVFIPYLVYRGYFKATFLVILFYPALMFFPSLVIGHEYNMSLLSSWSDLINPVNQKHILDVGERSFHGLSTLLSTLFVKEVPDVFALEIPRNIADVSIDTLFKIIMFVRIALIGFTLYFLKLRIFKKPDSAVSQCAEISYILLLIPLIFPHQQHYAFLFAMPAFAMVLYLVMLDYNFYRKKKAIPLILILVYLVFNLKILLGTFNAYYDHFKVITYAALALIPLLAYVTKKHGYLSPLSKST